MSTRTQNQNPIQGDDVSNLEEEDEEEEVLKLEEEVEQIAQKVLEYRTTLPNQLNSTLASLFSSQRPIIPPTSLSEDGSEPGPESEAGHNPGVPVESNRMASLVGEDQEEAEKIQLLIQKISSNASTMHIVLKRMKDYMARIDKLESSNGIIHPAFKRKRTS
ncbi:uncharacterized protein LOC111385489 [Olea europaea var. sylvestris]|uniref:uncharacterized protein LOC111385489 n=1 Tax=Olea europaea var. sylvestris TaxID=158386 RepID=UPI000C1D61C3|nr:uncharacterized protein LOC111385489 [Olea europaea var. sylvestris]